MTCQRKGCRRAAIPRGRFCSDRCRYLDWDQRHPRADRPARRTTARRASREGRGARIYFTPEDLTGLAGALQGARGPAIDKVRAAMKRVNGEGR